jgi:hypothetical protein
LFGFCYYFCHGSGNYAGGDKNNLRGRTFLKKKLEATDFGRLPPLSLSWRLNAVITPLCIAKHRDRQTHFSLALPLKKLCMNLWAEYGSKVVEMGEGKTP